LELTFFEKLGDDVFTQVCDEQEQNPEEIDAHKQRHQIKDGNLDRGKAYL